METKLHVCNNTPDFDGHIANWLETFAPNPGSSGVHFEIVVCIERGERYTPYRLIIADGLNELSAISRFLGGLGLVEVDDPIKRKIGRNLSGAFFKPAQPIEAP